jgi:antitoxin component YwqK of YwqJK toxin-antitoxin module
VGAEEVTQHLFAAVALLLAAASASGQDFTVDASCRDGQPHGGYELRDARGVVRVVGAFNRGRRTGSFIFWNSAGVRVAHLPFDDDALSGTAALWYADKGTRDEPRMKVEAMYTRGKLNGSKRSWYPDGKPRAEFTYEDGVLRSALATSESGGSLPESEARALAARDIAADDAFYASLLELVASHLPRCDPAADRLEKA